MGREVRRVPPDWKHPKNSHGHFVPLKNGHKNAFAVDEAEWLEGERKWKDGFRKNYSTELWVPVDKEDIGLSWEDWGGSRPLQKDYMPFWSNDIATHYMMYETVTEGTPISPAFATPEELARWLTDNKANAFAGQTATYEGWLRVARGGYAPSCVIEGHEMRSGVDMER